MRTIGKGRHDGYLREARSRILAALPDGYRVRTQIVTIKHDHLARIFITRPDGSSDLVEFSVDRLSSGKEFSDVGARLNAGSMASVGSGGGHLAVHHSRSGHVSVGGASTPPSWLDLTGGSASPGAICVGAQGGERVRWALVLCEHSPASISVYISENNKGAVKWFASSGDISKDEEASDLAINFPPGGRRLKPEHASLVLGRRPHRLVLRDPHGGTDLESEDSLEVAIEHEAHIVGSLHPSFARCIGPQGLNLNTIYRTQSSRLVKVSRLLALPWAGLAPPPFYGWPNPSSRGV
jgi:hypothetical protein